MTDPATLLALRDRVAKVTPALRFMGMAVFLNPTLRPEVIEFRDNFSALLAQTSTGDDGNG